VIDIIDFGDIAFLMTLIDGVDLTGVAPAIASSIEALYTIGAKVVSEAAANVSSLDASDLVGLEEFL